MATTWPNLPTVVADVASSNSIADIDRLNVKSGRIELMSMRQPGQSQAIAGLDRNILGRTGLILKPCHWHYRPATL